VGASKQLPRLTREDVRDLLRAAGQLDAAALVLVQSSWQGKAPVLMSLDHVKQVIAGLYNRAEPAYLAGSKPESTETPQEASREGGAMESLSPAPIAAPAKEEA